MLIPRIKVVSTLVISRLVPAPAVTGGDDEGDALGGKFRKVVFNELYFTDRALRCFHDGALKTVRHRVDQRDVTRLCE